MRPRRAFQRALASASTRGSDQPGFSVWRFCTASCVLTKEMPTFIRTCRSLVVSKVTKEPQVVPVQAAEPEEVPVLSHVPADENGRLKRAAKCRV